MRRGSIEALCLLLLLWGGCAPSLTPRPTKGVYERGEAITLPPERPAPEIPIPEATAPIIEERPRVEREKLYSLEVEEARLRDLLSLLAKEAGLSLIITKGTKADQSVTISLREVTLREALDALVKSNGLTYVLKGRFLEVSDRLTRTFNLNYLTSLRSTVEDLGGDVLRAAVETAVSTTGGGGAGTTGTVTTQVKGQFEVKGEEEKKSVNLWEQIELGIQGLLSEEGRMVVNRASGTIMVTDFVPQVERIERFLQEIEESLSRQVFIEAKIIEVKLKKEFRFGIDWDLIPVASRRFPLGKTVEIFQQASPTTEFFQGVFTYGTAKGVKFTALLDMLSQQGEVKVISSPKIAVLNSQTALISVGIQDAYLELQPLQTVALETGVATFTPTPVTIKPFLGILMGVTPRIDKRGEIILRIVPIITDIREIKNLSYGGETFPTPLVDIREATTMVKVKDGETIIIGGLMATKRSSQVQKVPLLGDLPLLGRIFRKVEKEEEKSELVIILRPHIRPIL